MSPLNKWFCIKDFFVYEYLVTFLTIAQSNGKIPPHKLENFLAITMAAYKSNSNLGKTICLMLIC